MKSESKKFLATGVIIFLLVGVFVVGLVSSGEDVDRPCSEAYSGIDNSGIEDWRNFTLVESSNCDTFQISELEKPLLVETFAVWCSTCTNQQNEVKKYHEESNVTSVSLNVDRNEDEQKIRQHVERYSFDWKYSVSPSDMTRQLINEYGNSIAVPPRAPMILVCENGTKRLPNGVKPVSKLEEEVEKGC